MHALITDGVVRELFATAPALHRDLDVRDVSSVSGIAVGWVLRPDRTFSAPAAPALTPADLIGYAALQRWTRETGGITVSGLPIATDDRSKTLIIGARIQAGADSTYVAKWVATDGSIHDLPASAIIAVSNAVAAHVSACFAAFKDVADAINASPPTITSKAQIDAAFAAVA